MDEIKITITPDCKTSIKVVSSKGDCQALTKPIEDALGKKADSKKIHNPGVGAGTHVTQ